MALVIMRKGKVVCSSDDWDDLEGYAGGRPNEVCLWPFEQSLQGKVSVSYSDGAIALYTGSSFQNLCAYMRELHENHDWPKPHVFYTKLANIGVSTKDEPEAVASAPGEQSDVGEEEAVEPEHEPEPVKEVRQRRTRIVEEPKHEPVPEPRKRRSRPENTERIRRVRAG